MTHDDKTLRRYMQSLNRRATVLGTILIVLLTVNMILILGNQHSIMVMQTDALDKLNEISVAVDPEDTAADPDPEVVEPTATYQLTPEEFDLICRVVASEARGEDLQGQMAVANVILDRSVLWDMPVTEVVTAPGQFAGPYQGEISDETRLAVANVFDGGLRVFQEPVTHFAEGAPYWTAGKESRGSVGRHQFWY